MVAPLAAEMRRAATEVEGPTVVNMSETGLTPLLSAAELEELGFAIVLFPSSAVRVTAHALQTFMRDLHQAGDSTAWVESMASLERLNALVGFEDAQAVDAVAADTAVRV